MVLISVMLKKPGESITASHIPNRSNRKRRDAPGIYDCRDPIFPDL